MACNHAPTNRPSGFILAVTLWILAGMALVASIVALWSLEQVREATAINARTTAKQDMIGTRDSLLYLLATTPRTRAGLPVTRMRDDEIALRRLSEFGGLDVEPIGDELSLAGRAYQGQGAIQFSLQDEAGFLSLFWPQDNEVDRLLTALGIAAERIPVLRDRLLDYIDRDDLRRLHGAEASEYANLGLPPPANRRLLQLREIRRVAGWSDLPVEVIDRLAIAVSVDYAGALNLNAAPAETIALLLPECLEGCRSLIEARELALFSSGYDVQSRLGLLLPGDALADYRFSPSETLRITLWGQSGNAWCIHVRLTPLADQAAPWLVSSVYSHARATAYEPARSTGSPLFAVAPVEQP